MGTTIVLLYVLNLGHTPVLGHFVSAQQDIRCTNFHCVKKLKPIGTAFSHDYYYICRFNHLEKVKGDDGLFHSPVIIPLHQNYHV